MKSQKFSIKFEGIGEVQIDVDMDFTNHMISALKPNQDQLKALAVIGLKKLLTDKEPADSAEKESLD